MHEEQDLQRIITRLCLYEEEKLSHWQQKNKDHALATHNNGKLANQKPKQQPSYGLQHSSGKDQRQQAKPSSGQGQMTTQQGCNFCHRTSHIIKEYNTLHNLLENQKAKQKSHGNTKATPTSKPPVQAMATTEEPSACRLRKEWLHNFTPINERPIYLSNNHMLHVVGLSMVNAIVNNSAQSHNTFISNILYIPGLTKNLITPSCLINQGLSVKLDKSGMHITLANGKKCILQATPSKGMLVVQMEPTLAFKSAFFTSEAKLSSLSELHCCLGHVSKYTSTKMSAFLAKQGIRHTMSAPYTPELNRTTEQFNCTILGMVQTMLHHTGLHESYWAEALHFTIHIYNSLPHKGIQLHTPSILFNRASLNLTHIHTFSQRAFMLIPPPQQTKLSPWGKEVIYLSPSDNSNHHILKAGTMTVHSTQNIKFTWDQHNSSSNHTKSISLLQEDEAAPVKPSPSPSPAKDETAADTVSMAHAVIASLLAPMATSVPLAPQRTSLRSVKPNPHYFNDNMVNNLPGHTNMAIEACNEGSHFLTFLSIRPSYNNTEASVLFDLLLAQDDSDEDITPNSYRKAMTSAETDEWVAAMEAEHTSLVCNNIWTLQLLPSNHKAIMAHWAYRLKCNASGQVECYKAHWVCHGFSQCPGINYNETFSLVMHIENLHMLLAYATAHDLKIEQMDIDNTFLQADLDKVIYIEQPEGFVSAEHPTWVCRLNKSLYRLKQAPLTWNQTIDAHLQQSSFIPTLT